MGDSSKSQVTYRNMKYFNRDAFRNDLRLKLGEIPTRPYGMFEKMSFDVPDSHVSEKKKPVRFAQF